jgi:hypothetical protein
VAGSRKKCRRLGIAPAMADAASGGPAHSFVNGRAATGLLVWATSRQPESRVLHPGNAAEADGRWRTLALEREQKPSGRHRSLLLSNREAEPRAGDRAVFMLPERPSGEQIEVRVECVGRVDETVGGVLAEAFDPLSDVRRERGHGGWG